MPVLWRLRVKRLRYIIIIIIFDTYFQPTVLQCILSCTELTQEISKKINFSLHATQIRELLSPDNEIPPEMLNNFIVFGKEYRTKLFDLHWQQQKTGLSKNDDITYSHVYENVWKPTISSCLLFLNGIYTKSLLLSDIKKLSVQNLGKQIQLLSSAMLKCYPNKLSFCEPFNWITGVVKHIEICQKFINNPEHLDAIRFCLKFKKSLQLTGDFLDITNVWNCVSKMFSCMLVCTYVCMVKVQFKVYIHR